MSGTAINVSGRPISERQPDPIYQRLSNYRVNAFHAPLAALDQDTITLETFLQTGDNAIPVILFTSDYPAVMEANSYYDGVRIADSQPHNYDFPQLMFEETFELIGDIDGTAMATLLTGPSLNAVDAGEIVSGATVTNGVEVTGYAAQIPLVDRSLQDDQPADIYPYIKVVVLACGAVIDGYPSNGHLQAFDGANVAGADVTTVLLNEAQYTQAMHDAGNYYVDTNGDIVYIAGLFAVPEDEPPI